MAENPNVSEASCDCSSYSSTAVEAELSATDDIKPGVYEGGFKTWECAVDLATYLAERSEEIISTLRTGGLHVIEVRIHLSKELCWITPRRAKAQNILNAGIARSWNRASNLNPHPTPLHQKLLIINHFPPPPSHTLGLQCSRAPLIHNTQYTPHLPDSCNPNTIFKIFRLGVICFLPFQLRIKSLARS